MKGTRDAESHAVQLASKLKNKIVNAQLATHSITKLPDTFPEYVKAFLC